ncbi:precorrin-6A reductase [Dorea sp. YH-dor228]|uniref:precorrin-6A reductase n=1 Tax=Dorea sp. YH-dor228 TaxID=3151120 RepID=UPI003242A9B7
MKEIKILIFGGTTEGRKLAEYLVKRQVQVHVCVATSYGESLLPEDTNITVSHNRMDCEEMQQFIRKYRPRYVVDATHPYAKEVTENLRTACEQCNADYLRLVRESSQMQDCVCVENMEEAIRFLEQTEGNILVTTGSKELEEYTRLTDYQERVYARVLSLQNVAAKCEDLGFTGRHLICMQGPFSVEMNLAMLREFEIAYLVTKESGNVGGYREKCQAARLAGVGLVVIGRPFQETGLAYREMCGFLKKELNLQDKWKVSIVGIGMGPEDTFTVQGKKICQKAQLLIGAKRMLESSAKAEQPSYAAYKPEEILAYIKEHPEYENVVVALSGDVGFYSGAKKLLQLLQQEPDIEAEVVPGISSVAYFCARLGISWDDAALTSVHGRKTNLISVIRNHKKTIALSGNADGVRSICREMMEYGYGNLNVCIGSDLAYEAEKIESGTAESLVDYNVGDLAVVYIENPKGGTQVTTHGLPDREFVRGDVPMTKEEVRSVSLSKLHLKRDSIVYDVGAGTGSVSVEAAIQADQGHVYAIERNEEAVALILQNQRKMKVDNLTVIAGEAPDVLEELPAPDCVFIGGSKGHMKEIIQTVAQKNPKVRVVINAIALETLAEAVKCCDEVKVTEEEIVQISVAKSKSVGSYHMMMGQNPVSVISFTCNEDGRE